MTMDSNSRKEKEELLRRLREKSQLVADSKLKKFQPNPVQEAFLISKAKVRLVEGANRSGKTEVCAVDTLCQVTGEVPAKIKDIYPEEYKRPGRYWVSSTRYPATRDVARPKIEKYLPKKYKDRFNEADYIQYLKDGSQVGFKTMAAGRDAYAGDSRYQIWMDEEHDEDVYNESYMRTVDCSGRIVMSFTPVEGLTWAYQKLYMKASRRYYSENVHGIPEETGKVHTIEEIEKMRERRLKVQVSTDKDADPDIEVFQMTIYDNIHLPAAEIQRTELKFKDNLAEYQSRILGLFAKITGNQVYPVELTIKGQARCPGVWEKGEIENGKFVPKTNGNLVLFKKRETNGSYVIGADVAEGLEIGDYSCAQILHHITREQVGVWHGKTSPENFANILIDLGKYFNYAWLVPERNFHGFGVVNRIRDQRYNRLYCDDNPDLRVDKVSELKKYGWETNARTKPIMVQDLGQYLSEKAITINDVKTWDELMTYVYHPNGRTGALRGCYDDRAVALMIALQGCITRKPVRSAMLKPVQAKRKEKVDPYTNY